MTPALQLMRNHVALEVVTDFLTVSTPDAWFQLAAEQLPILLMDHANCEKKAASTALNLLYRYTDRPELLDKLSRLAREELRHFEQVLVIMCKRNIDYAHIGPSRYAGELRKFVASNEPDKLVDTLIVGAFIEARSCERFAMLVPRLDKQLAHFYQSLLRSEARHFQDYLALAESYAESDIAPRIDFWREKEAELVLRTDSEFRFHSGPLIA